MTIITGTSGDDVLIGTNRDDLLIANGGTDVLKGKGGADTYQLHFGTVSVGDGPFYTINETNGGDSAIDTITGISSLTQYNYGVIEYAEFSRSGTAGQHLIIHTPFKPHTYYSDGVEAGKIKIVNQYRADTPTAQIEKIQVGAVEYNLLNTNLGTLQNDIITGWRNSDTIRGDAGSDYLSGGDGADALYGDAGADVLFGGNGADSLYGGTQNDLLFGGNGKDRLRGGDGDDALNGGIGNDVLKGDAGNDVIFGGAGKDRLFGGGGHDQLSGSAGNNTLKGGAGRDTYFISTADGARDLIIDRGRTYDEDTIVLTGFASMDAARHAVSFQKSGDDLRMAYEDASASVGDFTLKNQYANAKSAVEHIRFQTDAGNVIYHFAYLKGDDYTYSVHSGSDIGGEDIVMGSSGNDHIYGGIGSDILIGGTGIDTFVFHDEDDSRGGVDIILDFDPGLETLDFTEIKTLTAAGVSIIDNAHGNAVISSIYGSIELDGISAAEVTTDMFAFF